MGFKARKHPEPVISERFYIAITDHYWGKGISEEAAVAACRKAGGKGRKGKNMHCYLMPEGAHSVCVDPMGNARWLGAPQGEVEQIW